MPTALFAQPAIMHYRLPVFDELRRQASGRYEIEVHGPMAGGAAIGGGEREYLFDMPVVFRRRLGVMVEEMPRLISLLKEKRPQVLVQTLNPRCLQCYQLPKLCRQLGISLIGWTKAQSEASKKNFLAKAFRSRLYNSYPSIVAYGHCTEQVLTSQGYPPERVYVARNTIDTRRIFTERERIDQRAAELRREHGLEGRTIVLCISRMDPEKRVDDLLDAWPEIAKLGENVTLVIAGGGQLLDHVRSRAAEIDSDRIRVLGRVPEGDDYTWIAAADANVQCGAVGLAINQSLALGTPTVIADERGSDTEIVEHGQTGWRYPKGDLKLLTSCVQEAISGSDAATAITRRAVDLMRDEVTIENMASTIDRCISDALATANQH